MVTGQQVGDIKFLLAEPEGDDKYFSSREVSNSDLGNLDKLLHPERYAIDATDAYRFGTLFDAIATEPEKVNYHNLSVGHYKYSHEEFKQAEAMYRSLMKDEIGAHMVRHAEKQVVMKRNMEIEYEGLRFTLNVRCKWDFVFPKLKLGGDLKSTTATTQQQFEAACKHFKYDRQRAWYMDIGGTNKDILIGVSKAAPHKVFRLHIERNDNFYLSGQQQYQALAFNWKILVE